VSGFEKRPAVLDMLRGEVRFYQEIAPIVGVRVPACHDAVIDGDGTWLTLESLSHWAAGADPVEMARVLSVLHEKWQGETGRWPWLRPVGAGDHLVGARYDEIRSGIVAHPVLTERVRDLAAELDGAEDWLTGAGPVTLCHGDASSGNARTGPAGEIALLGWRGVTAAPGVLDLAWLLVSSTGPERWDETMSAYGKVGGLEPALPGAIVRGLVALSETGSDQEQAAWGRRLDEAAARMLS
jgi:hypothetical protein